MAQIKTSGASWNYNQLGHQGCRELVKSQKSPLWARIWLKVSSDMAGCHIDYQPGELAEFFSVNQRRIDRSIKNAVEFGFLETESSSVCLRTPRNLLRTGSKIKENKCVQQRSGLKTKRVIRLLESRLEDGPAKSQQIKDEVLKIASKNIFESAKKKLGVKSFRQANVWFMALPADLPKPNKKKIVGKPAKKPTKPVKRRKLVIVRPKPIKPPETKAAPKKYVLVRSPIVKARESPENSSRVMSLEYVDTDRLDELLLDLAGTKASKNGNSRGDETQTWFETEQQTKDRIRAENQLMFRNLN